MGSRTGTPNGPHPEIRDLEIVRSEIGCQISDPRSDTLDSHLETSGEAGGGLDQMQPNGMFPKGT